MVSTDSICLTASSRYIEKIVIQHREISQLPRFDASFYLLFAGEAQALRFGI